MSTSALVVALQSVGTAATLAAGGVYLHRRIGIEDKMPLARFSQHVALPCFFFSKLVACSDETTCPTMEIPLILFLWPLYVVGLGLAVSSLASRWIPPQHRILATVAITFANATALPVTLLGTTEWDVNALFSVYCLLYPMLLWGYGGWLLQQQKHEHVDDSKTSEEFGDDDDDDDASLIVKTGDIELAPSNETTQVSPPTVPEQSRIETSLWERTRSFLSKVIHPPVIGSLLGLFVLAIRPLRLLLAPSDAPLAFWFRGIATLGQATVPVSMTLLGMNLSRAARLNERLDGRTLVAVLVGKLLVLPLLGFASVWVLLQVWEFPPTSSDARTPTLLVLLIEFIPPTANNVMIMVEVFGSHHKEQMALLIGWQYVVSPLILSLTFSAVVHLATRM